MLVACTVEPVEDDDGSASSGSGSGQCSNLAGSWTVSQHCESSEVGETFIVTQSGCNVSIEPYGFSGTLQSDGSFSSTGMPPGAGTLTCTGTATGDTIDQVCEPGGCVVQLTR